MIDCEFDECNSRDICSRYLTNEPPQGKINTLLSDLLEKEEEITVCKDRLKELESAFYYNLEVIAERDLEISVLEKQLRCESEKSRCLIAERDELEDLLKVLDEKKNRKIQQLETKLALKEDEIREMQKDHISNINALKRIIDTIKAQRDAKMCKLNNKYEIHKRALSQNFQEEIEEKEKIYLQEINNLKGKLEQARREKDELSHLENEYRNLKYHLDEVEKLFQEKENYYLEEINKMSKPSKRLSTKEVQCSFSRQFQSIDKNVQAQPDNAEVECQTKLNEMEDQQKKKLSFLQEQNEVLKKVIKDMKKNKNEGKIEERAAGSECSAVGMVEQVNKKFESEINGIKKILEQEKKQRREEEAAIQSLETSITCLKDKLISELQEKIQRISDDDNHDYRQNPEILNEIQVTLLEEKLSKKIDAFMTSAREEQQKLHKKLEEIKKEWIEKMEKYLKPKEESKSDNLLEKIRVDIQKLENKIESDMKNIVRNNSDKKCEKYRQSKAEPSKKDPCYFTQMLPFELPDCRPIRNFCCNDLEYERGVRAVKVENKGKFKSGCKKPRNDFPAR